MTATRSRTYLIPKRNRDMLDKLEFSLEMGKSVIVNLSICLLAKNLRDVCKLYCCDTVSAKEIIHRELYTQRGYHIISQIYGLPEFQENQAIFSMPEEATDLIRRDYLITERTYGILNTLEFNMKSRLFEIVNMGMDLFVMSLRDISDAKGCSLADARDIVCDSLKDESYSLLISQIFYHQDIPLATSDLAVGMKA